MANVPGANLLNMAMTIIREQTVQYYRFESRLLNLVGQYVTTYEAMIELVGSWQPVPRTLYASLNLSFQKDYFTFYTSNDILDITRDTSADQIEFMGKRYQVESNNDWYQLDGWKGVLCCNIGVDDA